MEQALFLAYNVVVSWLLSVAIGVPCALVINAIFIKFMFVLRFLAPCDNAWRFYWGTYPFKIWKILFMYNPFRLALGIISIFLMLLAKLTRFLATVGAKDILSGVIFFVADFEHGANEVLNNAHKTHMAVLAKVESEHKKTKKELEMWKLSHKRLISIVNSAPERQYTVAEIVSDVKNESARFSKILHSEKKVAPGSGQTNVTNTQVQPKSVQTGDADLDFA